MTQATNSRFIVGILIGILGAICFSSKAIFVKLAYREAPVDTIVLLALRMLMSLPFFVGTALYASSKADNTTFTARQWFLVAFTGIIGYYVSSFLDFEGLRYIPAGIERLVLFVYPTLVLLMSAVFLRKPVTRLQWTAVIVTYAGLFIAFRGEASLQEFDRAFVWGSALIFACAITYAIYIVMSGQLIPAIGAAKFNSYAMTFAGLAVLAHFFLRADASLLGQPAMVYVYSFLMAIVSTVIPSYLVAESIKRVGSNNAAIVASVGPVSTIVQAYFILQEPIHALQLAGTAFIIAGVWLIGRKR